LEKTSAGKPEKRHVNCTLTLKEETFAEETFVNFPKVVIRESLFPRKCQSFYFFAQSYTVFSMNSYKFFSQTFSISRINLVLYSPHKLQKSTEFFGHKMSFAKVYTFETENKFYFAGIFSPI